MAERGLSTVELLVGSALLCCLSLACLITVRTVVHAYVVATAQLEYMETEALLEARFRHTVQAATAYSSFTGISVISGGTLSTPAAGAISGHPLLGQAPQSDAVSFLILDPAAYMSFPDWKPRSGEAPNTAIRGCYTAERQIPKFWLALGLDGYHPVVTSLRRTGGLKCGAQQALQGTAAEFSGIPFAHAAHSLVRPHTVLEHAGGFVPVLDSFTFYLSRAGELRRLSHISIGNQPVLRGVAGFAAGLAAHREYRELQVRVKLQNGRDIRISVPFKSSDDGGWLELLQ